MAFDVGDKGAKKGRSRPDMNVTPLVDVVLVLLIIFMVITPLLAKQFWVNLPTPNDQAALAPSDAPPAVVTVRADGSVFLNQDRLELAELNTRVERVLAARGDRTVFFDAHDDAPYGRAVEVFDTLRGAGATTIAVATESITP